MSDELTYRLADVITMELQCSRRPSTGTGSADVNIEFAVVRATFAETEPRLAIECEYEAEVLARTDENDEEPEVVAKGRARVAIILESSRLVTVEDINSGLVDPAQILAHEYAHPYLRTYVRQLFQFMGMPPVPIPITVDEMRHGQTEGPLSEPLAP